MPTMKLPFMLRYFWSRIFWFFAIPIRTLYRFAVRPKGRSVKVLIVHNDKVLLVRPNYGHRMWSVPGGALGNQEIYEDAARREIREELSMQIGSLCFIGEYSTEQNYRTDAAQVFLGKVESPDFAVDGIEIKEAGWFGIHALPENRRERVDEIIDMYGNYAATN